ncbi:MAG TPA: head GIN domain-containing protein [Anaeromyxobacteraceae bacterium]|nr:head GIN domain-containing protein [Anaeromyxobacteraceae bacterium]
MRTAAVAAFTFALLHGTAHAHPGDWGAVRGNGQKTTEIREVPDFDAVALQGAIDARVKVGGARTVAVTIDANLQPHVRIFVEDGRLVVRTEGEIDWRGEARVEISVPALRDLSTSGSGDASIEGGEGDLALATSGSGDLLWHGRAGRLAVSTSGSGDAVLSGRVQTLEASTSGSGDLRARDLSARDASIRTSGSGDVDVTLAGGSLRAATSGSGDVTWGGEGSLAAAAASGSGRIRRR